MNALTPIRTLGATLLLLFAIHRTTSAQYLIARPPVPPSAAPAVPAAPFLTDPTIWSWDFLQNNRIPNITQDFYSYLSGSSSYALLSRTQWGISSGPGAPPPGSPPGSIGINQLSSFATQEDAVLNAQDGNDLIITNRSVMAEGNNNEGAIRFGTTPPLAAGQTTAANDVERVTILNNGNVGIGTPEPATLLHLYSSDPYTTMRVQSTAGIPNPRVEFWAGPLGDHTKEWQPGLIQMVNEGDFTGAMEFYTNGSGSAQRFGYVQAMKMVNGRVGIGANPVAKLQVTDGSILFNGTTGSTPVSGAGTRMMWIPSKSAFRAGKLESSHESLWNEDSVGEYSFAFGLNTRATNEAAFAVGELSEATGFNSVALGRAARATGYTSVALGLIAKASGEASFAVGHFCEASGSGSVAIGSGAEAYGAGAVAIGVDCIAGGDHSVAMGYGLITPRDTSVQDIIINGIPYWSDWKAPHYTVFGRYNYVCWCGSQGPANVAFQVGNGTSSSNRSNALTLWPSGNMTISGTLTESSDARIKHDLQPLGDVLSKLADIQPVYFRFNDTTIHPGGRQLGFVAQEIERAWPEVVGRGDYDYLTVSYSHMSAVAIQAIKELHRMVGEQRDELHRTSAENHALEERIGDLEKLRLENAELKSRLQSVEDRLLRLEGKSEPRLGDNARR